ncbi:MAG: hypothetical protein Q9172_004279 [Xanthocarpia lactea]
MSVGVGRPDRKPSDDLQQCTEKGWNEWRQKRKKQGGYFREHDKCAGLKAGGNILGLRYRSGDGRKDWRYHLITSTLAVRSWILDNGLSEVTLTIGPRVGLVLIGFLAVCPGARHLRPTFKKMAEPWNKENLHFLRALLDAGARINDDNNEKLAEQGLMDAIKKSKRTIAQLMFWRSCLLMLDTKIR